MDVERLKRVVELLDTKRYRSRDSTNLMIVLTDNEVTEILAVLDEVQDAFAELERELREAS